MAETSEGWDGTINEAGMARILAAAAAPRIDNGFAIGVVAGERRVILSPGESHYAFIRYVDTDPRAFDIPAPPTGTGRWHLLVQRRDWENNTVTYFLLQHTNTGLDSAALTIPTGYPDSYADNPGVVADLALYWVWVRSSDNTVLTFPIPRGRAYTANAGTDSNESSGIAPLGGTFRAARFAIPHAISAGSMLNMRSTLEVYCPIGSYAGYLRLIQLPGGGARGITAGVTRWHNHGRGGRWLQVDVEFTMLITEDVSPGSEFALDLANDSASAGGVEVWWPRTYWHTY